MNGREYNQLPNKRLSTMDPRAKPKGSKVAGYGDVFLQAEEKFQSNQQEEWKTQKKKNNCTNKLAKETLECNNRFEPDKCQRTQYNTYRGKSSERPNNYRGNSSERPAESLENKAASNKRTLNNSDNSKASSAKRTFQTHDKQKYVHEEHSESDQNYREKLSTEKEFHHSSMLSFTKLQQISAKDSTDIIRTLANSQSGLEEFLSGKIRPDLMYLIIKILSKLTGSDWEENKENVLIRAATPEFFKKITEFVTFLVTDEQSYKRREEMEQFFENLLNLFHAVMNMLPTVAADHLMAPLRATKIAMSNVTEFQNVTINSSLHDKMKQLMSDFEQRKKEKEEREQIFKEQKEAFYPKPLCSIREIPLYPRPEDIHCTEGSITKNKIKGPYNNVEHYLDVQFRLLREDFIAPVRQGINEYRVGNAGKTSRRNKKINNIRIYNRVKFLKPKVISDKVGYDICFDPEKRLKVKWECTKRFIYGSLLLFTNDNFHTFFLATVVNRDLAVVEKDRIVSIVLCDTNKLAQDILSKEFLMAESEVYFEPYYNVLKALQKFNNDTFPMKKYIVYVETKTERPAHTRNGSDTYTISVGINGRKTIKLFDSNTWPDCSELDLDITQLTAFKAALTSNLAVIQGPPGTGKTYVGLKIAAALLENSAMWNQDRQSPILIICYTNHALDQFLEGILVKRLTNNLVRIGGRSKSEVLEPFNLKERRKNVTNYSANFAQAALMKDLKREMSSIFENIKTLQDNLEHLEKDEGIISLRTLKLAMNENHQTFFKNNDDLLQWLLLGVSYNMRCENNLISSTDKEHERKRTAHVFEEFSFDSSDFENAARLKEVLFDSIELEESVNESDHNIHIYFTLTFDEIEKKMEHYAILLDNLLVSEDSRESLQTKMQDCREAESNLKYILTHFKEKLKKTTIPNEEETNRLFNVQDLHSLIIDQRWALYKSWIEFLKAKFWMMIGKLEERYRAGIRRYEEGRQFDDLRIVQQADVVGITTTTAARLQIMLRELKPKIVIVEEAAEVLEAHIVASLPVYCQHLILIGDHKQLRPSPSDYKLGKDYHLDISLFERLINNGVTYYTLGTQHRMRPEISRLLVPTFYPSLQDHPSTLSRQHILGMDNNMFFMTHNHFEEEAEDIMSKRNHFEARMVMLLARHLLLQGYRPDEITVLTTYDGQMYLMKDERKRLEISSDLLITVVDNFQGEENKIILLSLVRSNADNKIGFLKTDNRVCVALSRARDGLFVFGNMDCLTAESPLWQHMKQSFVTQNSFGPALILRCETHPKQLTRVMTESDFNPVREGGCSKPCNEKLPCGHNCKSLCHVSKDRHIKYRCSEPCNKYLCGDQHLCPKKCYQTCDQCKIAMKRTLNCGHQIILPCCVEYRTIQCKQLVTVDFPDCNHQVQVECYRKGYTECPEPCPFRLECGHSCIKKCHIKDDPDHLQYMCPKPCARQPLGCTTESHKCPNHCFEECTFCTVTVVKHLPCGHTVTTQCTKTDLKCMVTCTKTMSCGHKCKKYCYEPCGDCQVKVEKIVPLCGHKVKIACSTTPSKIYCDDKCVVTLLCGHKCSKRCKDNCSDENCIEPTPLPVALPCGHTRALLPCNMITKIDFARSSSDKEKLVQYCNDPCLQTLKCGHCCSGTCGQCMQGRIHKVCEEDCGNTLICGHSCSVPCRLVCPPCEKKCHNRCIHSKCSKKCGEPCVPCKEPCTYECVHSRCTKKCGDLCNRKPCKEPCFLLLPCHHPCVGFCGEPCPPCKQCNPEHYEEFFYTGEETEDDAKWILLNDCKHVVESRTLEQWLGMDQEGTEIKLKACPKCTHTAPNRFIATTQRFMNLVKKTFLDIQAVKEKVYGQIEDIREKRTILLSDIKRISAKEMNCSTSNNPEKDELYLLYNQLLEDLPITRNEHRNEIDIERLQVLDYMVAYFKTVFDRRKAIWSELDENSRLKMTTKLNTLTKALRMREKKISIEEVESFNLELNRMARFGDLLILESCGEFKELKTKQEVLSCFKIAEGLVNHFSRYTDEHDKKVYNALHEVKKVIKSSAILTEKERREIHLAMSKSFHGGSSAQGHWFKCPNGHIYVITECGGAMEKAKCPVKGCGALIGGENHRYVAGQQLASEMDGAARPAWSSGNDMNNFDLNNIR